MADNIITSVKNGDKAAFEDLLLSFEPLIRSETAKIIGQCPEYVPEAEEFAQEGRMALYDAAMSYKENDKVTFGLYAKICIKNRLISYLRRLASKRRKEARALEAHGVVVEEKMSVADEYLIAFERSEEFRKFLSEHTTELERQCFTLYLQKMSYADIAHTVGKSAKSVGNAICRVKSKLKKYFK